MQLVEDLVNRIENSEQLCVNEVTDSLNQIMLKSAEMTFPVRQKNIRHKMKKNNFIPGFNLDSKRLKAEYYKAKNCYKRNKTQANHTEMTIKSKNYKKEISKLKRTAHRDFTQKVRQLKSKDPKEYWRLINTRKGNQVQATIQDLYSHFKELSATTPANRDGVEEGGPDLQQNLQFDITDLDKPFDEVEIRKSVSKLKSSKSPGTDKILNEYIKTSLDKLMPIYVYLFNRVLDTGDVPEAWLIGKIIPIYKGKGNVTEPGNYRGITLLSCLGKLFTSMLNTRLSDFIKLNKILEENQAGFRKGYGTVDHIFVFKCIIDLFCAKKRKLFCSFVDYQKAFDTIWRDGLWIKLVRQGITGKILNVIRSMYNNIKSCVFSGGQQSEFFCSYVGVRQGENLSPLLFSLYVNDLEQFLHQKGNDYITFNMDICEQYLKLLVLMYADDTVIFANNATELQKALDNLEEYCTEWKLKVNCQKTKVTVFGNSKSKRENFSFTYMGNPIEIVDSFKYLGVIFNFNGNFHKWKKELSNQGIRTMYSVISKSRALGLSIDIQLELFDRMVIPVLTYACEVWGPGNNAALERVHLMYCKYILGLNKSTPNCFIYRELGRYPLDIRIKTSIISYWSGIVNNNNESKLTSIMYKALFRLHTTNVYRCKWLDNVESILNDCGMSDIWLSQGRECNSQWLKHVVKIRLQDQFVQHAETATNTNSKCSLYKLVKNNHDFENYLISLPKCYYIPILKLRSGNHKLPVVRGRYASIPREHRFCDLCSVDVLGDEYHFLFECANDNLVQYRNCHLPHYYRTRPSMFKCVAMLSNLEDRASAKKLGAFLKNAFSLVK